MILLLIVFALGKKVSPDSPWRYAGGPGIYLFTEFGKEYGNQLTNGAVKITDEDSNSKNDLLSLTLKLGGHLANIWHENLFKVIADEQRSGSLASDWLILLKLSLLLILKLVRKNLLYLSIGLSLLFMISFLR